MKSVFKVPFLLFLIIPQFSYSQFEKNYNTIDLHFNPLTLIDYTPRYRFGIEYNSNSNFAYNCEIGLGNYYFNGWRAEGMLLGSEYKFLEIRPEIKYNFFQTERASIYTSVELFLTDTKAVFKEGEYYDISLEGTYTYESANFHRKKSGLHIKLGYRSMLFDRLSSELYFGVGMAKRVISYSNVEGAIYAGENLFIEWVPQNYKFEGTDNMIHLTAGYKIGFLIWKGKQNKHNSHHL